MKPANIYTYTVPANGSVPIMVEGSFFKIIAATGMVSVGGDFGKLGPLLAGQGLKGRNSTRFMLNDMSGEANVVSILIADDGFIDDRISGEVSMIDGGKVRSIAAKAFVGSVSGGIPAAGKYAQAAIWNPGGSGVNIVLKAMSVSANAAVGCNNRKIVAELVGSNGGVFSKNMGRTDVSIALMQHDIVTLVAPVTTALVPLSVQANDMRQYILQEPLIIPPGVGFDIVANSPATQVVAGFEWFEEPLYT